MEAIGHLAGGVAHDFNNLLAVIRGNTELVLMKDGQFAGTVSDCLKQVVAAADRAANLTRQLLAFSRKQVMQSQPLDLNDVIGNFTKMLKRIIGEDIQLQCNYAARLPAVQADVGMLEQVLVNLVVNARDAMPKGGQLLITTEARPSRCRLRQDPSGGRAGDFVSPERDRYRHRHRAGTLAAHLRAVLHHQRSRQRHRPGSGDGLWHRQAAPGLDRGRQQRRAQVPPSESSFRPSNSRPACRPATDPVAPKPAGGSETILLVEDDEAVRSLTGRLLKTSAIACTKPPRDRRPWNCGVPTRSESLCC